MICIGQAKCSSRCDACRIEKGQELRVVFVREQSLELSAVLGAVARSSLSAGLSESRKQSAEQVEREASLANADAKIRE